MSEAETPDDAETEPATEADVDVAAPEEQPDPVLDAAPAPVADQDEKPSGSSAFMGVPIEILISVGKARPLIGELLELGENSVLTLDRRVDDPVEIYVGDRLIARGELEELDGAQSGQLAVRLTEVAELRNGLE